MFCKDLGAHTSFLIQFMRQACKRIINKVFFSFRVVFKSVSCHEIRKEREELIEVSFRYCSFIKTFTIRTTCTMRGSLIKSSQFQTRSRKGVSQETRMLEFKKKYFKLPN